jgi:hypothetical protein
MSTPLRTAGDAPAFLPAFHLPVFHPAFDPAPLAKAYSESFMLGQSDLGGGFRGQQPRML